MSEFKPPVRRRGPFFVADQALALGPPSIGSQQANTLSELFSTPWTLQFEGVSSLGLRILSFNRFVSGEWEKEGLYEASQNAQHIALAFDQSARPVIAWEQSQEFSTVRYWDEAQKNYLERSFSGVNPVLINDALAHFRLEDSDVVLFYLSDDRTRVYARIQRERYDTEHEVAVLDESAYLDQVAPLPYQLELLLRREAESVALTSELYPVRVNERVPTSVSPLTGGRYRLIYVFAEGGDALKGSLGPLRGGIYTDTTLRSGGGDALGSSLSALRGGEFRSIYLLANGAQACDTSLTALRGGEFIQSVLPYSRNPASISGSVGALRGGSYDSI